MITQRSHPQTQSRTTSTPRIEAVVNQCRTENFVIHFITQGFIYLEDSIVNDGEDLLVSWRKPIMMKTRRLVVGQRLQVGTIIHTSPKILHLRFHGNDCLDLARRLSYFGNGIPCCREVSRSTNHRFLLSTYYCRSFSK